MLLSVKNTRFSVTMSLFEIFHIHFFFFFKLVLLRWKNIYLCKANGFLRQFLGFWYKFANASEKSSLANKECFLAILFYNSFVVLMSFSFFEVNYESILNQSLLLGEFSFFFNVQFCCFLLQSEYYTFKRQPTKWSDIFKQFVGYCRRIAWVCLTILQG